MLTLGPANSAAGGWNESWKRRIAAGTSPAAPRELALRITLFCLAASLSLVVGCDGDDPSEVVSYVDSLGRSCSVDLADVRQISDCDVDPDTVVDCAEGNVPVFTPSGDIDPPEGTGALRNCGGCLDMEARTTFIIRESCSNITCDADEDCVFDNYTCTGGICLDVD